MTINVVSFHAKKLNKTLKTTASHYYSLQILKWPFGYKYAEFWALKTYPAFKYVLVSSF